MRELLKKTAISLQFPLLISLQFYIASIWNQAAGQGFGAEITPVRNLIFLPFGFALGLAILLYIRYRVPDDKES